MRSVAYPRVLPSQFLILGAAFGLLYIIVNAPFAVNDEDVHLARLYELSTGRLNTRTDEEGDYHMVPADYHELGAKYQAVGRRKTARVLVREVLEELGQPGAPPPLVRTRARAAAYSPLSYHLELPAVWLARQLSLNALWALYLARSAGLLVYLLIAWRAVSTVTGPLQWVFFTLALMPMSLTQAAGVSSDGLIIALSLLYFALIAKGSVERNRLSRRELTLLGACLVVITVCKPVYVLIGLTLPLLDAWPARLRRWRWLLAPLAIAVAVLIYMGVASRLHTVQEGPPPPSPYSTAEQLQRLLNEPLVALRVVRLAVWRHLDDLLIQTFFVRHIVSDGVRFAGAIGGLLYVQLLALLAWGAARPVADVDRRQRLLHSLIFAACGLAVILAVPSAFYLCCTQVGHIKLRGLQGRYLIPGVPALALSLSLLGRPSLGRWITRRHPRLTPVVLILLNVYCLFTLIGWHYFATGSDWPL